MDAAERQLFDARWYLDTYPSVADTHEDPFEHFMTRGWREGRNPHPLFDSAWYLRQYRDVAEKGLNPLSHFVREGIKKGFSPHPKVDTNWWQQTAQRNTGNATPSLLDLILASDAGRADPHPLFQSEWYLQTNRDVAAAGASPFNHYILHGGSELRSPHPLFDPTWYIKQLKDGERVSDPLEHYMRHGEQRGLDPHPAFSTRWYLQQYPDVAASGMSPLEHFVRAGDLEHRSPHPLFDPLWYGLHFSDEAEKPVGLFSHYLRHGRHLSPNPLFDPDHYLRIADCHSGETPLVHYLRIGRSEKLYPNPVFDEVWYTAQLEEKRLVNDPFSDFLVQGDSEGLSPHPLFDPAFYRLRYADVGGSNIPPFQHYWLAGWREERMPHPVFDPAYYLRTRSGREPVTDNPLAHYLSTPVVERTSPHPLIDLDELRLQSGEDEGEPKDALMRYVRERSCLDINFFAQIEEPIPSPEPSYLARSRRRRDADQAESPEPASEATAPFISIIVPTYNSDPECLTAAINSVRAQSYSSWELILVDDGSPRSQARDIAREFAELDPRIRPCIREQNGGISRASNDGINEARFEYLAFLDHDDLLLPNALSQVAQTIQRTDADVVYTDQAYVGQHGEWVRPFHKPDWSSVLTAGVMYVGHLLVVRKDIAVQVGGFDPNYDRVQDFEFMLRVGEITDRIAHVPEILYHWRMIEGSIASNADAKGEIEPLQADAVNGHLSRIGAPVRAAPHPTLAHRLKLTPGADTDLDLGVVVLGDRLVHQLDTCVGQLEASLPPSTRMLVVGAPTIEDISGERTLSLGDSRADLMWRGVMALETERVLVVDAAVDLGKNLEWLQRVLMFLRWPKVALAGPHISDSQEQIVSAGYVLDANHGLSPAMSGMHVMSDGQAGSLSCDREVTAVSPLLWCAHRNLLEKVGGHDPSFVDPLFSLADLSIRAMQQGFKTISVSEAPILRQEYLERPSQANVVDRTLFLQKHQSAIKRGDPFFNPNFSSPKTFF